MSQLDLSVLLKDLSQCYPAEDPSEFSETCFDLLAIIDYRGSQSWSEYKIRWRPSRLAKIHLLSGIVGGRPLRDEISKVFQAVDRADRVRVIWKDKWVPAESVLDFGELLHDFWAGRSSSVR